MLVVSSRTALRAGVLHIFPIDHPYTAHGLAYALTALAQSVSSTLAGHHIVLDHAHHEDGDLRQFPVQEPDHAQTAPWEEIA